MKKIAAFGASVALLGSQAHAALSTDVTTAITAAQTDLLALMGALTTAGVAIWVGRLIYNKFRVR
ncbi:MAG: hypothetical protein E6Q78_03080 [Rhodoferax sp.]|nr:MAG: hypothetical protein E6Q78_03080 [Rhodoferax sp.]